MRFASAFVVAICSVWLISQPAFAAKRVALVIGNSAYQNAPLLANPANDSAAMATMLKDAGFDIVQLKRDLKANDMRRALRDFMDEVRDADVAIVYYAGHGLEINGINYMIPVDAVLERDIDAYDEAIPLDRILAVVEPAKKLRLIILDACRDNPFSKAMKHNMASRSVTRGLSRIEPSSPNTLIAYAAKAGSTAADGDDKNSPFTTALVKHLPRPGLDLRIAFGFVRDEVMKATHNRQEPFVYGSLGGDDVTLVPAAPPPPQTAPPVDANASAREDYELALDINVVSAWDSYIKRYPSGFYTDLAIAQRNKLIAAKIAAEEARLAAAKKSSDDAKAAEAERARVAAQAKAAQEARIAAEQAKAAEQTKMAEQAKVAEQANAARERDALEKQKAIEEAQAAEAVRAKAAREQAAALAVSEKVAEAARAKAANEKAANEKAASEKAAIEKAASAQSISEKASAQAVSSKTDRIAAITPQDLNLGRDAPRESAPALSGCGGAAMRAATPAQRTAQPLSASDECTLRPRDTFRECTNCPEMVMVPAGEVLMGSERGDIDSGFAAANESPQHKAVVRQPIAVGRFEVTRDQYAAFVKETGYNGGDRCFTFENNTPQERANRSFLDPGFAQDSNHPVVCVSWVDAKAYVDWLARTTGKSYRLLSEAEFEYVARAGTSSRFGFSNDSAEICKFANGADQSAKSAGLPDTSPYMNCRDGYAFTAPVGSFTANAFGLYDVIGNVWEWTEDCFYGDYATAKLETASRSAAVCSARTVRGGDWFSTETSLRPAVRAKANIDAHHDDIGFRVVRTLTP